MQANERDAQLQAAILRLGQAWANGDGATLDALLSPTATHIDVFGAFQDRASWLAYAKGRAGRATRIAVRDVQTRMVGDVAVVTGINEVEGPGARNADDRTNLTLRFTQVWRFEDGMWLREAFQATPISTQAGS